MSYGQQPYQQGYPPQPYNNSNEPDSVGSWVLTIFLLGIPLVGFIYLIVLAVGDGRSVAKRNFARAWLIWYAIGVGLVIILGIITVATGTVLFAPMLNELGELSRY